jgi:hypothetical protein
MSKRQRPRGENVPGPGRSFGYRWLFLWGSRIVARRRGVGGRFLGVFRGLARRPGCGHRFFGVFGFLHFLTRLGGSSAGFASFASFARRWVFVTVFAEFRFSGRCPVLFLAMSLRLANLIYSRPPAGWAERRVRPVSRGPGENAA